MEVINISGTQGRFSPELFHRQIGAFSHIRRLDLIRVQKTAGPEPLVPPEVLMSWRLEALYLSQTTLNEQTVDSISAYLASPRSDILRQLHLNQCGLSGRDLAVFFRSMTRTPGWPREMFVTASENRLRVGISNLFKALGSNHGPSSLTMRMLDFEKEYNFRELVEALTTNTTLRTLDISRASLPYDASPETCEALKTMFASNSTLEELDMSGEHAHLDATRFGIGLNLALRGLEHNKTLRVLRVEYQSLGLQGATTLAEVIQKNRTLCEIHCEHNDTNLQSFTVLVNALEHNTVIQYLPSMVTDREVTMDRVRREIEAMEQTATPKLPKIGIKKSFTGALTHRRQAHSRVASTSSVGSLDHEDVLMAITALDTRWDMQVARLQKYLYRNYCLASGIPWVDGNGADTDGRPGTSSSIQKMLDRVMSHPKSPEKSARQDALGSKKSIDRERGVFELPED
jgi:Ran GTPase-activating protein (RanGAP) involved in mRNA processing and transport